MTHNKNGIKFHTLSINKKKNFSRNVALRILQQQQGGQIALCDSIYKQERKSNVLTSWYNTVHELL
jgi:hypothetical protein